MGTRRSRHNKGRKPFYKDHNRTTLADILPVEASGWEAEAEQFLSDRDLNRWREMQPISRRPGFFKVSPQPELGPLVQAYMAKRAAFDERQAAAKIFPDVKRALRETARIDYDRAAPSDHDVLIELFFDRKITASQLHAGRRWQGDKEWATIQPNRTIDWARTVGNPYQRRGEITDSQWGAMKRRREFTAYAGIAATTMLDFCLDADRGRGDLAQIMRVTPSQIDRVVNDLLWELCRCFGKWRLT